MCIRIIGAILLALCGLHNPLHAAPLPESTKLDGLTIELPSDSGWNRTEDTAQQIVYERIAQNQPVTLTFSTTTIEPQPKNEAFYRFAEAKQERAFSKLERVAGHYYYGMHEQGAPCARYDGIFEDKTNQALPFINVRGQLCRHPASFARMIRMELSQRFDTRESAYKADLSKAADQAFDAIQFAGEAADPKSE